MHKANTEVSKLGVNIVNRWRFIRKKMDSYKDWEDNPL